MSHILTIPVRFARSEVLESGLVPEPCVTIHDNSPETFMLQIRTKTQRQARMALAPLTPANGRALIAAMETAIARIEDDQARMNEVYCECKGTKFVRVAP